MMPNLLKLLSTVLPAGTADSRARPGNSCRVPCRQVLGAGMLALVLIGCATNATLERSRKDFAGTDRTAALLRLEQAVKSEPDNLELRGYYLRQRDLLVIEKQNAAEKAYAAGRLDDAQARYRELQAIDPDNPRARLGLEEIERAQRRAVRLTRARAAIDGGDAATASGLIRGVLAEAPDDRIARSMLRELDERTERLNVPRPDALQGPMSKPVTLEFREAPLRVVFEALSRASGLNFVFDKDVRVDTRVTLFVRDNSVDEVLRLLTATQGIERKLLNANSVLIYPATPAKQRDHLELVTRSFYLANADAKSAQAMVKQLVKSRDVFIDEKLNLLVVKDTPDAVRMAERLIAALDVPEPEVMLELEVLEISRSKLLDLGVDFPDQVGYGLLTPSIPAASQIVNGVVISGTTQLGGKLLDGNVNLRQRGDMVPFIANPAAMLRLRAEDGDSSTLANPRIRVRNREKAKVHIGDKLPLFTTTSTANVGVSASVSYLDVGLKLEVEPSVYRDDEVGIKLNLEVSNIVKEVPGPSSSLAYQVGTRSTSTSLRLRNGETQVLAGLISDEERSAAQRLPGLGHLPVLGRLFSAQRDSNSKTEIVLLITPRILRNVQPPVALLADMPAGTETSVGSDPLRVRTTRPGSLGLRGGDARPVVSAPAPMPVPGEVRGVAPEGTVNAEEEVTPGELPQAGPKVSLNAPETVRRGEAFSILVEITGLGAIQQGEVSLVYDAARLETEDATVQGVLKLPVNGAQGRADVLVNLKAKPQASGTANVVVTALSFAGAGAEASIPMSVGATMRVVE